MTQPEDSSNGRDQGGENEHTDSDLHGTAREVAEGQAGDEGAPTPGGG